MSKKEEKKSVVITDDSTEIVHELVSILSKEGFSFTKNDCPFCVNRVPKLEPRECPVCKKLCYPKQYAKEKN